ncbi:MAG: hypothetical protein ACRCSK_07550 [Fusobacteriaceae bacterium]
MKKILMVTYGGGHAQIIKHVYEGLQDRGVSISIFALTKAQEILKKSGIKFKGMLDYHNMIMDDNAEEIGKHALKKLKLDFHDLESILYYGYNFKEIINEYGEEKAFEGYKIYGRAIFLPLDFMRKIFEIEKPDLVVTTTSPRMEKAALIVAKKQNIPSVYIENLFVNLKMGFERFIKKDGLNGTLPMGEFSNTKNEFGEYIFVMSEYAKRIHEAIDIKRKVIITGQPSFDEALSYYNLHKKEKKEKCIKLLFLGQKTEESIRLIEELSRIVLENKSEKYKLIIKLHPNESRNKYDSFLKENKITLSINDDLYSSISQSDIVVSVHSTALLEASIMDKLIIGLANSKGGLPLSDLQIGLEFEDIKEIEELLEKILTEEIKNKLKLGREIFRPKKFAKKIIADKLIEILER